MWDRWRTWADRRAVSFFQSADWAEVLVRHYPFYRPEPIETNRFFLPMIRHHRQGWLSDSLYSMPFMTTGGLLAEEEDETDAWRSAIETLSRKSVGSVVLSLPPRTEIRDDLRRFRRLSAHTHLIDLSGGWETVYSRFKKSCREAIRRAERQGVAVHVENDPEGLEVHWRLIEPLFPKWRPNPPILRPFLEDLVKLPQTRLYLARVEGRPVLSLLAFIQGGEIFLWQSARTETEFPPGASNLLTARLMEDACSEGCRLLNFGGSLGESKIESYKEAYGAVRTPWSVLKRVHPAFFWKR